MTHYRRYRASNLASAAKYRKSHKRERFSYALKARYGISRERFDAMLISQCGLCDICLDPMESPSVDHSHESGMVRALLCQRCNAAIGMMREDPEIMDRAKNYILKFKLDK